MQIMPYMPILRYLEFGSSYFNESLRMQKGSVECREMVGFGRGGEEGGEGAGVREGGTEDGLRVTKVVENPAPVRCFIGRRRMH